MYQACIYVGWLSLSVAHNHNRLENSDFHWRHKSGVLNLNSLNPFVRLAFVPYTLGTPVVLSFPGFYAFVGILILGSNVISHYNRGLVDITCDVTVSPSWLSERRKRPRSRGHLFLGNILGLMCFESPWKCIPKIWSLNHIRIFQWPSQYSSCAPHPCQLLFINQPRCTSVSESHWILTRESEVLVQEFHRLWFIKHRC